MGNLRINQNHFSSLLFILVCWIHRQSLLSVHWYYFYEYPFSWFSLACYHVPQQTASFSHFLEFVSLCLFFNSLSFSSLENAHCSASPHLNLFPFPKASKVFESWSLSFKILLETSYLCSLNWNFTYQLGRQEREDRPYSLDRIQCRVLYIKKGQLMLFFF